MKVIVSGGGTGGHIYPALTIAANIQTLHPEAEITFVGTKQGLESKIVPRYGYPMEFTEVAGFKRKLSIDSVRSCYKLFKGLKEANAVISKVKPDLVIGTGGYVCGPVLFLAALRKIPTCIQEQNAMPGVTNRILSHFVNKVFLGYEEGRPYFKGKAEKIYTGNPVRQEINTVKKEEAYAELGLDSAKITVLIFGGSRGARSINKAAAVVERSLAGRENVQVLHSTGADLYAEYMASLEEKVKVASNIHIVPYLHAMPLALAIADVAIARSGAIGLAELVNKGIPSILIPYPLATGNHQEHNARALEKVGAAKVILDKELTGEGLHEVLTELLQDKAKRDLMQQAAYKVSRPQAGMDIAHQALALLGK